MESRYQDRKRYFDELAETSRSFYIDYVRKFINVGPDTRVLEIGCGEGGNLLPFAQAGCEVTGVDLAESKIENARRFFLDCGADWTFTSANIFDIPAPERMFDLVLVHDVIEHIGQADKAGFIRLIKESLVPGGIAFIAFPAWYMPFGGHQQICRNKVLHALPWIHLLPLPLYRGLLKLFKEPKGQIDELLDIRRCKMTAEAFERICKAEGCSILDRRLWFINPHYKVKFGLRPLRMRLGLDHVPYLRDFFATSCWYVIR